MTEPSIPKRLPITVRLLALAAVAVALVAGLFAFGRISDDATLSMGLTAVWFGIVLVVAALLVLRRRELFWPLAVGYGAVAVAAAVLVIAPTLVDMKVDEQVVVGAPAGEAQAAEPADRESPTRTGNVQVAAGRFGSIAHSGTGRAAVVELAGGQRKLTVTQFETDPGPDLRLYVSTGDPAGGELGDFKDLGALKGNVGDQQYSVPKGLDLGRYSTVVVWCRAFSVAFTSAPLRPS